MKLSTAVGLCSTLLALGTAASASIPPTTASSEIHMEGTQGWNVTGFTIDNTPLPSGVGTIADGYGIVASSGTLGQTVTHSSGLTFEFGRADLVSEGHFAFGLHIWGECYSVNGYAESVAKITIPGTPQSVTTTLSDSISGPGDYNDLEPTFSAGLQPISITFADPANSMSVNWFNVFVKARK